MTELTWLSSMVGFAGIEAVLRIFVELTIIVVGIRAVKALNLYIEKHK